MLRLQHRLHRLHMLQLHQHRFRVGAGLPKLLGLRRQLLARCKLHLDGGSGGPMLRCGDGRRQAGRQRSGCRCLHLCSRIRMLLAKHCHCARR